MENLRDLDIGDRFSFELESGEEFEDAEVVDKDYAEPTSWDETGWFEITIEGGWWEQVNDRVESEVLQITQRSELGRDEWDDPVLSGHIWVGEPKEASTPEYKTIGTVKEVEIHGD